ncbi:MAG: hypothetical protein HeimC2_41720 [Candidatus Heimdallarchaeota archaeon LC_2]|nr:MAG: hypothetical protein HeimC2_41720 [Candidatus Heimdallarchaeota archaeon LC_2]
MIDDPFITNILFFPRKSPKPMNLPPHIQTLEFKIHDSISIGGIIYVKEKSLPTILMFHGNGEIAEDYRNFYNLFHDCNLNLAVVDYRGYGFSSGKPNFSSLIADAIPIFTKFQKWTVENKFSPQLYVMGRSLGSICASEIGSKNPEGLLGIIFESGFASLHNMITRLFGYERKDITTDMLSELSNDTKMKAITKPVLVIHGTDDMIIPHSEGKLIIDSLINTVETRFVSISRAGHNDIFSFTNEYSNGLKEFVAKINE